MRPLHFIFPLVLPISLNSCTSLTSYILVNLYKRLSRTTCKSYQRNTRIGTEATELTILWFLVMTGYGIHFLLYIGGSHISHAFIGFSLRSLNRRKISLKITQLLKSKMHHVLSMFPCYTNLCNYFVNFIFHSTI